ncbi:hypothetical protein MPTK1_1g10160 [Marchantia polymorpha subsp. ruderalis]|uniref:Uncharacterized protein n=2 Tax=Marchantia polymorpha TaxID=3197 RepID=A0AAF6ANJ0_MARPO|nr:hypothetical protein MARPO_0014s0210 [Marchantia polymorpha]BBM98010.1 hypothetical protein Mp_1g10160 [Marchantia polymorpha subsp. ruderalis]|eukprot:PTQ45716.1 hypothetical protein MARPO_0014s0210 [Marchantia polymorpha]
MAVLHSSSSLITFHQTVKDRGRATDCAFRTIGTHRRKLEFQPCRKDHAIYRSSNLIHRLRHSPASESLERLQSMRLPATLVKTTPTMLLCVLTLPRERPGLCRFTARLEPRVHIAVFD